MRWRVAITAIIASVLGWSGSAQAWGYLGHRIIADLAESELDPATRRAVQALLDSGGHASLADVAIWPDEIREQKAWRWTSRLHFVNFPRGECEYDAAASCPNGACVVGGITRFLGQLRDRSLDAQTRLEALSFVVHYIADAHQPLHAGWSDDKGGNLTQLRWKDEGTNLHAIWDYALIEHRGLERADYVSLLRALPAPEAGSMRPEDWVVESCRVVAEPWFYPDRRKLDVSYLERVLPVAESRMRLAAVRTSAALRQALAAPDQDREP